MFDRSLTRFHDKVCSILKNMCIKAGVIRDSISLQGIEENVKLYHKIYVYHKT